MRRNLYLAALLCVVAGGALAGEPGVCTSMCASEQRTCRTDAYRQTELDMDPVVGTYETNRLARAVKEGELGNMPARVADNQDFQRRRTERSGRCDTAYQRCVKACGGSSASAGTSEVLTKQGQAKRGAAAAR